MKKFAAGFFAGAMVLVIGTLGYLRLGLLDVRSDAPLPDMMARLLYAGIHTSVRRTAPKAQNPLPRTDETLIAGGKLYLNNCVGCHESRTNRRAILARLSTRRRRNFLVREQNTRKRRYFGSRSMESA